MFYVTVTVLVLGDLGIELTKVTVIMSTFGVVLFGYLCTKLCLKVS